LIQTIGDQFCLRLQTLLGLGNKASASILLRAIKANRQAWNESSRQTYGELTSNRLHTEVLGEQGAQTGWHRRKGTGHEAADSMNEA
jgi:hypothetical protein